MIAVTAASEEPFPRYCNACSEEPAAMVVRIGDASHTTAIGLCDGCAIDLGVQLRTVKR